MIQSQQGSLQKWSHASNVSKRDTWHFTKPGDMDSAEKEQKDVEITIDQTGADQVGIVHCSLLCSFLA